MDTEVFLRATNNNPDKDLSKKKWSTGALPLADIMETSDYAGKKGKDKKKNSLTISLSKEELEDKRGRRKSWHVGKLERKRRKSSLVPGSGPNSGPPSTSGSPPPSFDRHKRLSWYNIFVPDNWLNRSRRSSTEIGLGRSIEKIPYVRSKSRSVDHGFSPPFDIKVLRNKVEERFESVDRLRRDSTDGESASGSKEFLAEKKMSKPKIEVPTTNYTVEPLDTLASVAARFDSTPSELAILNKTRTSSVIFPGQVIKVPDKSKKKEHKQSSSDGNTVEEGFEEESSEAGSTKDQDESDSTRRLSSDKDTAQEQEEESDMLDSLRPSSPKPHLEQVKAPSARGIRSSPASVERFLKINVKHITDGQGVVSGVLLVTPNAVMFDPNVMDTLVMEHGSESYAVIAPMEFVVNAAIYHDIAHMRVGHTDQQHSLTKSDSAKPEIYYLNRTVAEPVENVEPTEGETKPEVEATNLADSLDSDKHDSLLVKDETLLELRSSTDDEEETGSVCSCNQTQREGGAFPKAFDRDLVTPTNLSTPGDKNSSPSCLGNATTPTAQENTSEVSTDSRKNSTDDTQSGFVGEDPEVIIRSLEERRKSSLDHHWAVPINKAPSVESNKDGENLDQVSEEFGAPTDDSLESQLTKQSCHDSGIDIRDPAALPLPTVKKAVYSDADILLSSDNDFVPPIPVIPDHDFSRKKTNSVSFSLEDNKENTESNKTDETDKHQESKKNKMLKRLSYPLSWMEGTFSGEKDEKESSLPSSAESSSHPSSSTSHSSSVFSKVFSRRSSVSTFIRSQHHNSRSDSKDSVKSLPKLDYRSMVSVDDMPELFVSVDIHAPLFPQLEKLELIPRPARSCEDPPLYLRLRMGKPKDKKIPKSSHIMSYGKKKMRPEYWFSVPRNRVDDLYRFLMVWVPHLYGDLDEETVSSRGYELVDSDTELWEDGSESPEHSLGKHRRESGDDGALARESWEIGCQMIKAPYSKLYTMIKTQADQLSSTDMTDPEVLSMTDELRRALYANSAGSLDLDTPPDLIGVTEILSEEHRKQLCRHLPARAEGYMWTLVFSTSQHGFSLNSMYRKMSRIESPILLVIQDTEGNVFGALTSCALKVSDHFYGTGESLLFTFCPEFQVFNWTGDNMYFIKGNNESLAIGAGDGKFGLWLDGDLYQGRTEPCNTYGNEPLSPQQDFVVKTLECWAFV
ncbi:oxidation resistance protein 1 isoform X6 [Bemisia tabaci]|uniref:oxidation resistance protein 1 isoform X6 n=1 Tax=Bemisia tabaci TaxID=7038 RepID=UPI0008F98A4F|nr:PREDICTED: oxidation resistance protein 1 isoform X1 [Bemisia tabaci]